jgi:hypothetical protein
MFFYLESLERPWHDPQEEAAMIQHRVKSIRFWTKHYEEKKILYYFKSEDNTRSYILLNSKDHGDLDRLLKQDPLWPYVLYRVVPCISTKNLIEECQDYLMEKGRMEKPLFEKEAIGQFDPVYVKVDMDKTYILGHKNQFLQEGDIYTCTFSPLLSEEEQDEIHQRTLISQQYHDSPYEVSDVNPVACAVGIVVYQHESIDFVREEIAKPPIAADTKITVTKLNTPRQALDSSIARLSALNRKVKD